MSADNAGTCNVSNGLAQLAELSNNILKLPAEVGTLDLIQHSK